MGPDPDRLDDADIVEALVRASTRHGKSRVLFRGPNRTEDLTVGDVFDRAADLAGSLQALGLHPGDVVAVQLPNWPEGAIAQVAAVLCGGLNLPILQTIGPKELEFILRQSNPSVLIAPSTFRGTDYGSTVSELANRCGVEHVVIVGDPVPGCHNWTNLDTSQRDPWQRPVVHPDDLALLVYTSGTTADPKGVQHSHRSLLAEVGMMGSMRPVGPDHTQLAAFPPGHVAGMLDLLGVMMHGTNTVQLDGWDPVAAARLVEEFGVTSSMGAPIFLSTLLDAAAANGRDLSTLRVYMVGAASVPPALVRRADAVGIKAFRCYGSSEHPTVTGAKPTDPLDMRAETDGPALPGSSVRIVDEGGNDVGPGVDGEILTRGVEQFVGYRDVQWNALAFVDGDWIRSGDIGRIDERGALTVTDRMKDIIVRGGENISSREVEDVLVTHPDVGEVAVVSAPDERFGERVCAFVVPRPDAIVTLASLVEHFHASGHARFKAPAQLEIVTVLPRTASGKVKKFQLRRRFQQ